MSEIYTPEPSNYQAAPGPSGDSSKDWMAIVALVVGILSLCAWLLPICGFPIAIAGIVFGILGLKSNKRTLAIVGLAMAGLAILATTVNAVLGAAQAIADPTMYQDLLNNLGG
jgi:hypothetical protein